MIRKTLSKTKLATFSIDLPDEKRFGMPTPTGTGFFVSSDGYFITALHVISNNGQIRNDIAQAWLTKEGGRREPSMLCQHVSYIFSDKLTDFALLKVDFAANSNKDWLRGRNGFPYINVSDRELEEGELIYSFGYPLSNSFILPTPPGVIVGHSSLSPRVTSAIISSKLEKTDMVMSDKDPKIYVLDKALNYGNSGGPIVSAETGCVHAFCSRFQPVYIPQSHLSFAQKPINIMIPSLYGIVNSLGNPVILNKLREVGVPIVSN